MQARRPRRRGADRRVRIWRRLAPLLCLALLAIPAAAIGAREEPDQITVRTGRHEGFGRIVFDWQVPVEFDAAQEGNRLRLTFNRAVVVDLSLLAERLPEVLERASGSDRDGRTLVELTLRPAVRAKVFALTDGRVVVDLPRPTAKDRNAAAVAGSTGAAGAALPGGTVPGPGETVRGGSEQSQAAPSESAVPPRAAVETEGSGRPELQIRGRLVEGDPVLAFDWGRPVGAAVFLHAGHLWAVFGTEAADRVWPADLPPELLRHLDPGHAVDADGGVAIRFRLHRPLAPEVERDGTSWRVRLRPEPAPTRPVEIVRLEQPARLLVVGGEPPRLVRVIDPAAGSTLEIWPLLRAGLGQPGARRLVDLELLATAQGAAWRPLQDQLTSRLLDDAIELGRRGGLHLSAPRTPLGSIPELATGTPERRQGTTGSVDGTPGASWGPASPPAAQPAQESPGAVGPPDARSSARAQAPASGNGAMSASSVAADAGRPPLDLTSFGHIADDQLHDLRVRLIHGIARSTPESRAEARLELARVFLAQAMAAEALGALGAIERSDPGRPEIGLAGSALAGAAQLLMDRHDEAEVRLVAAELDDDREAALWRAALAAAEEDWPRAMRELARSGGVLGDYPRRLQSELGLLLAEAAIEADEVARAGELLERVTALDLPPAENAQARFLTGVARARAGRSDDAEEIWEGLQDHADPRTRLRARLALMELRLSNARIDPRDALHALDHDRPLWRGHPDEAAMLDRMAIVQLETGAFGNAVRTWGQVRERFPEAASAKGVENRMAEALAGALLGRDPSLGPVRAYALYLDFAELIPAGAIRKQIARHLADQLAGLDLVDQAADLLGGLVDERLAPGERAALGARIAELRLREPDANAALHALEATEGQGEPPDPWMARREALGAQALERLERTSEALVRPADPPGPAEHRPPAKLLRRTGDVASLTRRLEALLVQRPNAAAPLTPEQQRLVLELALAHGGEGDVEALGRLAVRFAEAMAGAQAEQAFAMATMVGPPPSETEAALAHAGAQLKRIEDYLRTAHGKD